MTVAGGNPISPTERGDPESPPSAVTYRWTQRGMVLAGTGAALFCVGMWRVDGVMAAMGLAVAALLGISRIAGVLNLKELCLEYRGPRRAVAGKGFTGKLFLTNHRSFFDGFRIEFGILLLGEAAITGRVMWLEAGGTAGTESRVVLRKRGYGDTHGGWVESGFPFGLFLSRRALTIAAETGVYPAMVIPHELKPAGILMEGMPEGAAQHSGSSGEWRMLREWRVGDPVKKISWPASLRSRAAGGAILVREEDPPGSQAVGCLVVFHSYGSDGALIRPDRFEKALGLLCGTLHALRGRGLETRWVADFSGWEEAGVHTGAQFARAREQLISAKRAAWTEAHDLADAFSKAGKSECLVIISDMPKATWASLIPKFSVPPVAVDISNYDRSRTKRKGGAR